MGFDVRLVVIFVLRTGVSMQVDQPPNLSPSSENEMSGDKIRNNSALRLRRGMSGPLDKVPFRTIPTRSGLAGRSSDLTPKGSRAGADSNLAGKVLGGEDGIVCPEAGVVRTYQTLKDAGLQLDGMGMHKRSSKCLRESIRVYLAGMIHITTSLNLQDSNLQQTTGIVPTSTMSSDHHSQAKLELSQKTPGIPDFVQGNYSRRLGVGKISSDMIAEEYARQLQNHGNV
ncbi:hypothetical protein AAMO2058_000925300 [Amorphochlora amoebiformis]